MTWVCPVSSDKCPITGRERHTDTRRSRESGAGRGDTVPAQEGLEAPELPEAAVARKVPPEPPEGVWSGDP